MTASTKDLIAALRVVGDEVFSTRKKAMIADAIDRLAAELESVRTGDTCGRQCEGTAYRIAARNLKAENERLTAELESLRAQKPIAGLFRNQSNVIECFYCGSLCPIDGNHFPPEFVDTLPLGRTIPLFARPVPAAQAVPDEDVSALRANRSLMVSAIDKCYKMLLSEPSKIAALTRAEDILRGALVLSLDIADQGSHGG